MSKRPKLKGKLTKQKNPSVRHLKLVEKNPTMKEQLQQQQVQLLGAYAELGLNLQQLKEHYKVQHNKLKQKQSGIMDDLIEVSRRLEELNKKEQSSSTSGE